MSFFKKKKLETDAENVGQIVPTEEQQTEIIEKKKSSKEQETRTKRIEYKTYLEELQGYIAENYSAVLLDESKKHLLYDYIDKFQKDHNYIVEGINASELGKKLYRDMAEYSVLTPWLDTARQDIEEINVNAWNDITINLDDGSIFKPNDVFYSPSHAMDVIKRLLQKSGMVLDYSKPIVRGFLGTNKRITAIGYPVVDEAVGVTASIRIINPKRLEKKDFIEKQTATEEMLDFLVYALKYNISICIAGETNTGKTTLMSWILEQMNPKRIITIEEGVREFNLVQKDENGKVLNNVVHMVTKQSDDGKLTISSEKLLETSLTMNPDVLCVAEIKSSEAFAAQEAARTGHAVISTTHANSAEATYARICTLCTTKYDIDYKILNNLVREAFPIVFYVKHLEDNSRRIMKINECIVNEDGSNEVKTLWQYNVHETRYEEVSNDEGGKTLRAVVDGKYEKVNSVSEHLKKRFIENGMPFEILNRITREG